MLLALAALERHDRMGPTVVGMGLTLNPRLTRCVCVCFQVEGPVDAFALTRQESAILNCMRVNPETSPAYYISLCVCV